MAKAKFESLSVPPDALEKGGHEVLRASIVDGGVSVALRRSFDDPFTWGVLLVDLARHAARIYALETDLSEARRWSRSAPACRASSTARPTPARRER